MSLGLIIRNKGICDYQQTYIAMHAFVDSKDSSKADEIWFLQHYPVYTLGLNRQHRHIIDSGDISIIETDRGGQITYHGVGQLVVYLLLNLKRKPIGIKDFVRRLEQAVIDMLEDNGLVAMRQKGAPGIYVGDKKISSLGIRVMKGYSYHGLSINVDMDLSPYQGINPCGYSGLEMTQTSAYGIDKNVLQIGNALLPHLLKQLDYPQKHTHKDLE